MKTRSLTLILGVTAGLGVMAQVNAGTINGIYIDNAGKVGIGTDTPHDDLTIRLTKDHNHGINIEKIKHDSGGITFDDYSAGFTTLLHRWHISTEIYGNPEHRVFYISDTANSETDRYEERQFTIHSNGSIGMGIAAPTVARLEVAHPEWTAVSEGQTGYSIYAHGKVKATSYDQTSDERIKTIIGSTNNRADLDTLNRIEITDYRYKSIRLDDGPVKKVIGQQIRSVYPQAVTLGPSCLDDLQQTVTVQDGRLSLPAHSLLVGEVIRVRLEAGREEDRTVTEISSDSLTLDQPITGEVFLVGRVVKDFHYVDYDALSMLNISATQALSQQQDSQARLLQALERQNQQLQQHVQRLTTLLCEDKPDHSVCQ